MLPGNNLSERVHIVVFWTISTALQGVSKVLSPVCRCRREDETD